MIVPSCSLVCLGNSTQRARLFGHTTSQRWIHMFAEVASREGHLHGTTGPRGASHGVDGRRKQVV